MSFGVFHTVKEFEEASRHLEHPFDTSFSITDDLLQAPFDLLVKGPKFMELKRKAKMNYYRRKKVELEEKGKHIAQGIQ